MLDITKLPKEVQAVMQAMQAENEKLAAQLANRTKVTFKVSEKKAISVYGLQRWPVTLYRTQWEALLNKADELRRFIADNASQLATKPQD